MDLAVHRYLGVQRRRRGATYFSRRFSSPARRAGLPLAAATGLAYAAGSVLGSPCLRSGFCFAGFVKPWGRVEAQIGGSLNVRFLCGRDGLV